MGSSDWKLASHKPASDTKHNTNKMAELTPKDMERARFAFDIYDFEGKARMDLFYLGDVLRGLNLNPTLKMIEKLGGTKKKGEKFLKLEEFYPIYKEVKNSKDTGSFEDFIECLKLYDKMENGTMMLGELEHILRCMRIGKQTGFKVQRIIILFPSGIFSHPAGTFLTRLGFKIV